MRKQSKHSNKASRKLERRCPACKDTVEIDLSPGECGHCTCGALVLLDGEQLVDKTCSNGMQITIAGIAIAGFLIMCCGDFFYGESIPGNQEYFARVRFLSFVVGVTIEMGALAGFAWLVHRITPLQLVGMLFRLSRHRAP